MNTHKFCNTSLAMPSHRQLYDVDRGEEIERAGTSAHTHVHMQHVCLLIHIHMRARAHTHTVTFYSDTVLSIHIEGF